MSEKFWKVSEQEKRVEIFLPLLIQYLDQFFDREYHIEYNEELLIIYFLRKDDMRKQWSVNNLSGKIFDPLDKYMGDDLIYACFDKHDISFIFKYPIIGY